MLSNKIICNQIILFNGVKYLPIIFDQYISKNCYADT